MLVVGSFRVAEVEFEHDFGPESMWIPGRLSSALIWLSDFVGEAVGAVGSDLDAFGAALEVVVEGAVGALAGAYVTCGGGFGCAYTDFYEGYAACLSHGHSEGIAAIVVEGAAGYCAVANFCHFHFLAFREERGLFVCPYCGGLLLLT